LDLALFLFPLKVLLSCPFAFGNCQWLDTWLFNVNRDVPLIIYTMTVVGAAPGISSLSDTPAVDSMMVENHEPYSIYTSFIRTC